MKKNFKLLDLFSGAGGLSNGFEQTERFEIAGAVELNVSAQKTYIHNHGKDDSLLLKSSRTGTSDITEINFKELKLAADETVIIGGPPCQGFSNANRQKNHLISGNNQLVKEFARAVKEVGPVAFLMENVKTMKSDSHKFFMTNSISKTDDFGSKEHLDSISENPLYKSDKILLLSTSNVVLKRALRNYEYFNKFPNPCIDEKKSVSRLRSIERKMKSNNTYVIKSKSEEMDIIKILSQIKEYPQQEPVLQNILDKAITGMELILLKRDSYETTLLNSLLEPFFELNRLLIRIHELKKENILVEAISFNNSDTFEINASVYSYNVVEYLENFFISIGYSIDTGVVDASDFGVPQSRKRFIMIGVRNYKDPVKLPNAMIINKYTVRDAIGDLENIPPQQDPDNYNSDIYVPGDFYSSKLTSYYRDGSEENELYNHINPESKEITVARFKEINRSGGKNFHSLPDELKSTYKDSSRTQNTVYLRLNYDIPSPTVVNVRKSMWQHPTKSRAVTVREAARIQTFQDSFVFYGGKDQQYQQIGNAVPPLLAKKLAEHLLTYLD